MAHSSWLFLVYGIGLFYLFINPEKAPNRNALKEAWFYFVGAIAVVFIFTFIRAGSIGNTKDMALTEIWSIGISWTLVSISMFMVTKAFPDSD